MTEQTKREFLQLVVMKGTLECWAWAGDRDEDFRPIFRGQKAYRIQYEIHYGDIPAGFHVHHKCENSACVNPRHLLALSPDAHRAWHATKDKALRSESVLASGNKFRLRKLRRRGWKESNGSDKNVSDSKNRSLHDEERSARNSSIGYSRACGTDGSSESKQSRTTKLGVRGGGPT